MEHEGITLLQPGTRSCKYFIRSLIFSRRTYNQDLYHITTTKWLDFDDKQKKIQGEIGIGSKLCLEMKY